MLPTIVTAWVVAVGLFFAKGGLTETLCYTCDGVDSINDCNKLQRCQQSEVCYMYKRRINGGQGSKIYGGCTAKDMCCHHNGVSPDQLKCAECCDGDFCNNKLCNETVSSAECFNCNKIQMTQECLQTAICQPGNMCGVFYYRNNMVTYRCEHKVMCDAMNTLQKRISPNEVFQLGGHCCDTPDCNQHLHPLGSQGIPTTTTCPMTASTPATTTITSTTIPTTAPTTTTTPTKHNPSHNGLMCEVCSGTLCGLLPQPIKQCPNHKPYCLNTVKNDDNGRRTYTKECASHRDCQEKWWLRTSDLYQCTNFNHLLTYTNAFLCQYCCVKDRCNTVINPVTNSSVMFHP